MKVRRISVTENLFNFKPEMVKLGQVIDELGDGWIVRWETLKEEVHVANDGYGSEYLKIVVYVTKRLPY